MHQGRNSITEILYPARSHGDTIAYLEFYQKETLYDEAYKTCVYNADGISGRKSYLYFVILHYAHLLISIKKPQIYH